MKAIIWIIVIALVIWGIWWFAGRNNSTAGIPATGGDTTGQVNGASDMYNASSTNASDTNASDTPVYNGKG